MALSAQEHLEIWTGENSEAPSGNGPAFEKLQEAFQVFTEASRRFEDQYAKLESRVQELNLELEAANGRLRENLEEKQKMEAYLSTLLESLPLGVLGVDSKGRICSANRHGQEILNIDSTQDTPMPLSDALGWDGRMVLDENGQTFPLEMGWFEQMAQCRRVSPVPPEVEIRLARAHDKDAILRLRMVATQALEADAQASHVLLLEDVTEIRRLQNQAERNTRLAAMGEIATNVAHEIRNPLGSIELFASMLQRDLKGDEQRGPLAAHICTGVRCVDHIVANILQFSKPQRLVCSHFNLDELLDETLIYTQHALQQKRIELVRLPAEEAAMLHADADLLKQVFLNIILNGVHATPEGGKIGVETEAREEELEVRIWDNGGGLKPDILDKIFDPFFTTRRKGTGLGLTNAHNIVAVHKGSIEGGNRREGGAVFTVILPRKAARKLNGRFIQHPLRSRNLG